MSPVRRFLSVVLVLSASGTLHADSPLIEVEIGAKKLQGRVAARSKLSFWLTGQDGQMRRLASGDVKKFRQVSPQFKSWSPTVLAGQLQREWGKPFDVVAGRHYVVCAVGEKKAREYAATFEEFFRSFRAYFSVRGFKVDEPEFPLVAIVFPDKPSYARQAELHGISVERARAYYHLESNRMILYEESAAAAPKQTQVDTRAGGLFAASAGLAEAFPFGSAWAHPELGWGTVPGDFKNVMVHEATHQAAFNAGLHSRITGGPRWVIEGLATVFEAPGIANSALGSAAAKARVNSQELQYFKDFVKSRRKPQSLETFVSDDGIFKSDLYGAYGQAWALSFFLIETRPRVYAEYLRTIADRPPLRNYTAEERVADFKHVVSKEFRHLENEFLDFVAGIK